MYASHQWVEATKPSSVSALDKLYSIYRKDAEMASMGLAYFTFFGSMVFAFFHFGELLNTSSLLTVGGGLQCLGFALLSLKVRMSNSISGVSSKSLELYAAVLVFRLASTLVKNGYIPVDPTGDWLYQLSDVVTLFLVLQLLYRARNTNRDTYLAELDTFPTHYFVPVCVGLAFFTHGDLDNSWFFDVVWMISTNFDTVAMLPQLFLLSRRGGTIEALTSHYVAVLFLSRLATAWYWFLGYPDLAPLTGGFNACGYAVVTEQLVLLLFSADFMYLYVKSMYSNKAMVLPISMHV